MRFKIDENLHPEVASTLVSHGFNCHTVHEELLTGNSDLVLSVRCKGENRILITLDKDFADIRTYPPSEHAGMIVLRLGNQSRKHVLGVIEQVIQMLKTTSADKSLWLVTEVGVRIRK
jgi:predicted nuclease of predicted toxin-antitoxin system